MKKRIVTGISGLLFFVFLLWAGVEYYSATLFCFAIATYIEMCRMINIHWHRVECCIGLLGISLIFGSGLVEVGVLPDLHFLKSPFNLLIPFCIFSTWIVVRKNVFDIYQLGYMLAGVLYVGYGFTLMMMTMWGENGLYLTLLVTLVIFSSDTSAYFIGKKWGKKRLWPHISPKKTIVGSVSGVVFGSLMSVLLFYSFSPGGHWLSALGIGMLISMVGQIGDLVESALKRTMGTKDSGSILPGHGGFLDRFDSLLFAFIVLYTIGVLG